ncbi:heterokaryon incompatibility protein-domain-containing protein [Penicillium capsulatum]|uniref:Heterokaryon incompatibility protein-domain-containing protein n=1 Tax=Penicillium capsulatum TaxID=69766 RepID=A0A9W9LGJ1_9EURO|nr:heterokaryon incompatibility protein-domain-containing protein [Penicillium capsulatum]KAJ6106468.1 heterokaryon incompatibility protein-domain-containing protein [Penicillium capsulatum]
MGEAAKVGHQGIFNILLEAGWHADLPDIFGIAPPCAAAAYGQEAMVNMLLERKDVNPDAADKYGSTPLLEALLHCHPAIVKRLLRTGNVNVNVKDSATGQSALSLLAEKGSVEAVRLLLSAGAHPDTRDHRGRTPLSYATADGVDPNSKCANGQMFLAHAVFSEYFPRGGYGDQVKPNYD